MVFTSSQFYNLGLLDNTYYKNNDSDFHKIYMTLIIYCFNVLVVGGINLTSMVQQKKKTTHFV